MTAEAIGSADGPFLKQVVLDHAVDGAHAYTDDDRDHQGLPNHETVNHSVGEYVDDQADTNSTTPSRPT